MREQQILHKIKKGDQQTLNNFIPVSYTHLDVYKRQIQYMQSGEYTISSGKQGKVFKSRTRIIFTSCIDSKQNIHNAFFHSIPIICHIPSLQNRPIEDKEMLIIEFFKEEGLRLKKNILISSKAFIALVNHTYENNIEELSTCIQSSCANAYLSHLSLIHI